MEVIPNFDIHCGEDIHAAICRVDHDFYVPVKRYRDDHVFDEDKSVKWNREEVARQNEKQIELQRQARDMCAQSHANLNEAIYGNSKADFISKLHIFFSISHIMFLTSFNNFSSYDICIPSKSIYTFIGGAPHFEHFA